MASITISSGYVALFILLQLVFTLRVAMLRRSARVSLGHGNNNELEQRMRAHGNFTEVVPITLVALVLLELNHAAPAALHAIGLAFLGFRLMHYVAVAGATRLVFRFYGMVGTLATMAAAAITLALHVL